MTSAKGIFIKFHQRLHGDERGFTIIEAMIAITILVVGSFAVAQSLTFGLKATGIARQRLGAEALVQKQMERVRALSYSNVALTDSATAIQHSSDPENPNFWVRSTVPTAPTYAPDQDADLGYEPIITGPNGISNLVNVTEAGSDFTVYQYVTWVDVAADGLGAADLADGDGTDDTDATEVTDDANGHDAKRITVVVTWEDVFRGNVIQTYKASSLISLGSLTNGAAPGAVPNQAPSVSCPVAASLVSPVGFTAVATDPEGGVLTYNWDFGDGQTATGSTPNATHTYTAAGTYPVISSATDDGGLSTVRSGCMYAVTVLVDANEVQTITLGGATGGSFTITFSGQTTAAIPWNSSATGSTSVQKALKALSNVGAGDISVSGPIGGPYVLTFGGAYAFTDVPAVTVTDSLTPTAATIIVTTTQEGSGAGAGGSTARPIGTITINAGQTYSTTSLVTVALSAVAGDTGSPIVSYRFSFTGEDADYGSPFAVVPPDTALSASSSLSLPAQGTNTIYVEYTDAGGRVSLDVFDSIILDSTPPGSFTLSQPTRSPSNGPPSGRWKIVTVSYTAASDAYGPVTYYPEYKGTGSLTWLTTVPGCTSSTVLVQYCLGSSVPLQQWNFRIRAQDAAGNSSYSNIVTVHGTASAS